MGSSHSVPWYSDDNDDDIPGQWRTAYPSPETRLLLMGPRPPSTLRSNDHLLMIAPYHPRISRNEILPMSFATQVALRQALTTMYICHELFLSWGKELADSRNKPSAIPSLTLQELHTIVKRLIQHSFEVLQATKMTLMGHLQFSHAFAEALRKSTTTGLLQITEEMEEQMESTQVHAQRVSTTVQLMKETLHSLSDTLERGINEAKEQWTTRLKNRLLWLCQVLSPVFTAVTVAWTKMAHHDPTVMLLSTLAALVKELAAFAKQDCDEIAPKEHSDQLLAFFKYTLRSEVSMASERLCNLDPCYGVLVNGLVKDSERIFLIEHTTAGEMQHRWQEQYRELDRVKVRYIDDAV